MPPAFSGSRAGGMPEASRDRSLGTFAEHFPQAGGPVPVIADVPQGNN